MAVHGSAWQCMLMSKHPRSAADAHATGSSLCCRYLRVAIMQLMVLKPLVALLCAMLARTPYAKRTKQLRLVALLSMATAMHSIFTIYVLMKPLMRGLDASGKFLGIKVVVAIILLQQVVVSVALSAELIPEGSYGYTEEENAQRITCIATIIEMALFSLLLSYLFSHRSMSHNEQGTGESAGASADVADVVQAAARADGAANVRELGAATLRAGADASAVQAARTNGGLFEEVMGETKGGHQSDHQRRGSPEAVSLLSVRSRFLPPGLQSGTLLSAPFASAALQHASCAAYSSV
jgi:Organic solute transporter Ostalpha